MAGAQAQEERSSCEWQTRTVAGSHPLACVSAADGDSAATAKARRRLAAGMCKRLHELLTCLRVLVGTIVALPVVIDQQVGLDQRSYQNWRGCWWRCVHKQQQCRAAVVQRPGELTTCAALALVILILSNSTQHGSACLGH